ncbi:MAG: oxidoreductase [Litorilinea sp.]|jgi:nicotinate dehydrogenase subunit A|nr:MAG: oxidoreductase [Litorilinea sp.]
MPRFNLHVNGRTHRVETEPETPLLFVLRNDLGLKAAKLACGLEQCGACKVLVDGRAVPSCRLPVAQVAHSQIVTLEGINPPGKLHPVQRAFIAEQAAQCGYCTAGMVLAAIALLDEHPHPDDATIRAAMARHLCRCGSYDRIRRAIRRAAQEVNP